MSPSNPPDGVWPSSLEESAMVNEYNVNQVDAGHRLHPTNSTLPPSVVDMSTSQPMLSNSGIWHIAPALGAELSSGTEFPWPFQDGGIFGLSSDIYPSLPGDEYFDPLGDDYYHAQEQNSSHSWEFVSILCQQFQYSFLSNRINIGIRDCPS